MKSYVWLMVVFFLIGCDGSSTGASYSEAENTADLCQDSEDNDDDGLMDCADDECSLFTFCEGFVDTSSTDSEDTSEEGTDSDSGVTGDCEVDGCNTPPENTCNEEGNLTVYTGEATCVNHVCQYESTVDLCDPFGNGCYESDSGPDKCSEDLCEGVVCSDFGSECIPFSGQEGWLAQGDLYVCDPTNGRCTVQWENNPDMTVIRCGGPDKCVSVVDGDDYCDTDSE